MMSENLTRELIKIADLHKLQGFLYHEAKQEIEDHDKKKFAIRYLEQKNFNANLLSIIGELDTVFHEKKLECTLLKGPSLIGRIYQDVGQRAISDIDYLINLKDLESFTKTFLELGFVHFKDEEDDWEANNFKTIFQKDSPHGGIIVELHTRLFFHINEWQEPETVKLNTFTATKMLEPNYEISYLIGHLAFQHTFIKLFWLLDIDQLCKVELRKLDSEKIYKIAQKWKLINSHKMVFHALAILFKTPLPKNCEKYFQTSTFAIWKHFLDKKFLMEGKQFGLKYYFIKHATKDSFLLAIFYDLMWLKRKITTKITRFINAIK